MRRPINRSQLAVQNPAHRHLYRPRGYTSGAPVYGNPPQHSGVFRALDDEDKEYLADRAEHMRNVWLHFKEMPSTDLSAEDITIIASMAATGLLGDDGGSARHERKFAQAIEYAENWLITHQGVGTPSG